MTVRTRPLPDRLTAALSACRDLETLSGILFDTVAVDVGFAFACLATTDPTSGLITGAYKSHPLPVGDEEFAASEYGDPDINQFADVARRPVPVGVLSIDTEGDLDRCRRFRDFMAPRFGFTDELRLACRVQGTVWGALALYRGGGEPRFTERDAQRLAAVHEVVAVGIRRTLFASASSADGARVPVVLIVDGSDQVTATSAAANDLIDELGGWDNGSLPANVLAVAASARMGTRPTKTRVRSRSGRWLIVQAVSLDGQTTNGSVVVTIDNAGQAAVGEMTIAARGLTARERDVAWLILQGASTKVIATSLFISPHTVQDHLKAIFTKLGVSSRREMIAQLALTPSGSGE